MSTDEPGPSHFKDIKARFESGLNTPTINNHHSESNVEKTKRLFEKTKNPINASNRFKPALKPKPKFLSQQKLDSQPPPVPKHASFNRSIVSPVSNNKFNFSQSYTTTNSNVSSCLGPSPLSSALSSSDNLRDSFMSDDVLPATPTATDTPADSSSSEDSSPEYDYDDDDFYVDEENVNGESSKVETLHTSVINQMKKEGLFKQLEAIKENNQNNMVVDDDDTGAENGNQGENDVIIREPPDVPPHGAIDKYPELVGTPKDYAIAMDILVCEIGMKEEYFVRVLNLMIRRYPEYLSTCKGSGSKYYTQFNEIVAEIVRELEPVLRIHETLLNEFVTLCSTWDSREPNLAHVLFRNVDFLQICVPFLVKKDKICKKFKETSDADAEFAHATYQFEVQVMNDPSVHASTQFENMIYKPIETNLRNSGVCFYQQLDMVHQNVVRYKLFADRYAKYLPDAAVQEKALTAQVVEKLDKILKSVDAKINEPNALEFLAKVYDKFQALNFNVLSPGRRFIKKGAVQRQARKELMERELILFTDTLLICHLDYSKFWKIDLRKLIVEVEDGVERENWFRLFSPKKSTAIQCASKIERDNWVKKILQTQNELRSLPRRNESINDETAEFSALWVADDETTMCMMEDCARRFTLFQRRHHCRKCGYVICRACSAFALLPNGSYEKSRVCPPCYYEVLELMHNGTMEWSSNVKDVSEKRIRFSNGKEKPIKDFFIPPKNGKKTRGDDYSNKDKYIAAGTVYTKSGTKYARLTNDFNLYIFAARYDPIPAEHYYVQGYSYTATNHPQDERVGFKLTQQTGPKSSEIDFQVHEKSASAWTGALNHLN
jgi:hypothetical protein